MFPPSQGVTRMLWEDERNPWGPQKRDSLRKTGLRACFFNPTEAYLNKLLTRAASLKLPSPCTKYRKPTANLIFNPKQYSCASQTLICYSCKCQKLFKGRIPFTVRLEEEEIICVEGSDAQSLLQIREAERPYGREISLSDLTTISGLNSPFIQKKMQQLLAKPVFYEHSLRHLGAKKLYLNLPLVPESSLIRRAQTSLGLPEVLAEAGRMAGGHNAI